MASNDVNIGIGRSAGMFYTAPAGTALPTELSSLTLTSWTEVADITEDGCTIELSKDKEQIKNWAKEVVRVIMTDHSEKITGAILDTTEDSLKALAGEDNVAVTAATSTHGKIVSVNMSAGELPPEAAYLFLVKDGDDVIAFGCSSGQISLADNVSFTPGDTINWPFEIEATGSTGLQLIKDDGQTT